MWLISGLLICMLVITLYGWRQAFENNVCQHTVTANGEDERQSLFFISDTHARKIDERMIEKLVGQVDFVIIGGDFVDSRTNKQTIEQNIQLLKRLGPVYFVWGNNDREVGVPYLTALFEQHGVTVLMNDAIKLKSKNNLWLSAIDDTSANYNIEKALEKWPRDEQLIFVSHNPQIFPRVRKLAKPILMLGGHLHGGQIRFGKYGKQPHGSYREREGVMTLVSNGYGTTLVPIRIGAKPQCHLVEIHFQHSMDANSKF